MANTPNGWPVLDDDSYHLHVWVIPKTGGKTLRVRRGNPGFILVHLASWFNDRIEPLAGSQLDDWGHNKRAIAGTSKWSEHAGGTAVDLNALKHPQGVHNTFKRWQRAKINLRLRFLKGVVEWGGKWDDPDDMHWQLRRFGVRRVARRLRRTRRGKRILALNESQKQYVA